MNKKFIPAKIPFRRFGIPLLLSFLLAACASGRAVRGPEPIPEGGEYPAPEDLPGRFDRVMWKITHESDDLPKYFVQDEESLIVVKSDILLEDDGNEPFEARYDLAGARPREDGRFLVDFTVEAKRTGDRRNGQLLWTPQEDATGVLLSLDDDFEDVWESNFDLFDRYGAKITFFVLGQPGPFCTEALNRGHDVGYHSAHHLNLLKVSREVFFEETLSGIEAFRAAGIPLKSFAYPFGLWEPSMLDVLVPHFKLQRGYGVSYHIYNNDAIREGYISSTAIDNILYKDEAEFDRRISLMLRTVKFIGKSNILPLTTHTISDTADWGIKPRRLEYVLQTVRDLKLKFYRYGDL
jgi:peptidoglycan/xylan/chitin deacetylase (PgdA/CDA1 family)